MRIRNDGTFPPPFLVMLRHGRWFERLVGLAMIMLFGLMSVIMPKFDFEFRNKPARGISGSTTLYQSPRTKLLHSIKEAKYPTLYNSVRRLNPCG